MVVAGQEPRQAWLWEGCLYLLSAAAAIGHQKLGGSKQHKCIPRSLEARDVQRAHGTAFFLGASGTELAAWPFAACRGHTHCLAVAPSWVTPTSYFCWLCDLLSLTKTLAMDDKTG